MVIQCALHADVKHPAGGGGSVGGEDDGAGHPVAAGDGGELGGDVVVDRQCFSLYPAIFFVMPRQLNQTSPRMSWATASRFRKSVTISWSLGWVVPVARRTKATTGV